MCLENSLLNLIRKWSFKKDENSISPLTQSYTRIEFILVWPKYSAFVSRILFNFKEKKRERANSIEQIRTRKNVINFSLSALISFSDRVQPINIWQMPKGFHNIIPSSYHYPIFNSFFQELLSTPFLSLPLFLYISIIRVPSCLTFVNVHSRVPPDLEESYGIF